MPPIRFAAQITAAVEGEPWHGPGLSTLLADVSAADACARPIAGAHTIWGLVLHLTAWTREVTRRMDAVAHGMPADGDWPAVPSSPGEAAWKAACDELIAANNALIERLARVPVDQWNRRAGLPDAALSDPPGIVPTTSYSGMISGLLQHHAYHGGQIALLKRALGK